MTSRDTSSAEAIVATAPADINPRLSAWVQETAECTQPAAIHWCDGSQKEYDRLCQQLVDVGTFTRLSGDKRPNSFLARSDPRDIARVEDRTFICASSREQAGPTNNWRDPRRMRATLMELFEGSMRGRTMYVVPFSMGPIGSDKSYIGVLAD
jgi:phosphoenolpyruvate carboxykinase (GTP)